MKRDHRPTMIFSAIVTSAFLYHFSSLLTSAQADAQGLERGVVKIIADKGDKGKDTGAGIVIGIDDGTAFILTAYHVVEEAKKIEVVFSDRLDLKFTGELFEYYNEALDMAVVIVRPQGDKKIPSDLPDFVLGDASKLRVKEKVTCIGHPADLEWEPSYDNTITGLSFREEFRKFRFTKNRLEKGNSGGPVFNEHDALIGMAVDLSLIDAVAVKMTAALEVLQQAWRVPTTKITQQAAAQPTPQPTAPSRAPTPTTPPPTPPSPPKEPPPSAALQQTYKDPTIGMEFVLVKGGCFEMGDTFGDGDPEEKPVHQVCVNDFYMGKHEVTQGQWKEVMGSNPSRFQDGDNFPAKKVSWNDVQEFIAKLRQTTGNDFRLPTEAEWEYAARSGGKKEKWAGTSSESELEQYAWYRSNSGETTHPVGQKRPNGLGLYDMSGNVWEWCADWYGEKYYGASPKENPQGPVSVEKRVLRGGSWYDEPRLVRAAYRYRFDPSNRFDDSGFRLVLPPK